MHILPSPNEIHLGDKTVKYPREMKFFRVLVPLMLCPAGLIAQTDLQNPVQPVNVILDSDMATNADDTGDHAMLWAMAARGEVNVLALILSSTNDYSAPCAHAIATFYGHSGVPIGANQTNIPNNYKAQFSYYTQQVAAQFGTPGETRANYPDAVTVYRRALAGAADHSVYIVAGGYFRPLMGLLQSGPDAISPLTGVQLVGQKVKRLIPVAGRFPDSFDNDHGNLWVDPDSASYVVANWPAEIVWMPDDQGWDVITGPAASTNPALNPVKLAYDLYCSSGLYCADQTPGWTQLGLLHAIRGGVGTNFSIGGQNGSTVVWDTTQSIPGRSIWSQTPNRQHAYLQLSLDPVAMSAIINPLVQWIPAVIQITQPPIAAPQSISTSGPVAITLSAVDPQGARLAYSVVTQPLHGTLSGTPPNLTYTPASGYLGSDSFTFRASNGVYQSNTALVSITVTAVNQAPIANSQTVTTTGSSIPITLTATDSNGNPLTYYVVNPPVHGTLSGLPPNLTYTPAAGYNGTDSLTFRANDGVFDSNTATVTIIVNFSVPTYTARVNAGGPSITDSSGNVWQADVGFDGGSTYATSAPIAAAAGDPRLFQTERYAGGPLRYTFSNVPAGTYTVNLYFAEIYSGCFYAGCRVFDVVVQGTTILPSFDIYAAAGGGNIGIARSTTAAVTNGTLSIVLQAPYSQYPTISAIEITPQNPNSQQSGTISGTVVRANTLAAIAGATVSYAGGSTITSGNGSYTLSNVPPGTFPLTASSAGYLAATQTVTVSAGGTTTANFALSAAGPSAIRVNAGGPSITDGNGNVWQADTGFDGGDTYSTTSPITATAGDPRLYQTEHYASGPLQYTFSNVTNGTYTVNLYFAEIYSGCFFAGCRVFDVAVQGTTFLPSFDVWTAAGGGNIGIVRSTSALVTNGTVTVALQAPYTQYPTISAIEIIHQ
jgi:hypothetical protein